jgi:Peptidase S46.
MKAIIQLLFLFVVVHCGFADEGMWLFNHPAREQLRERYKFEAKAEWLERLQKASIRFNVGGSASFVSEEGLLISNHHVGRDAIQKLSTQERNLIRDGFLARKRSEELKCVDLELNVLQSIEDVTDRVNAAVPQKADAATAFAARRNVIAEIEKESLEKTGLRSDVVTLWQGGAYHLYRYKRYTDVRLVFAPEQQIAFFGGDPDNFEFPRYDLDVCFFRAYENGKPADTKHFLRFSPTGAKEGELVFVSGHPGRTSRLLTVAELTDLRDRGLPMRLKRLNRLEVLLSNWSNRNLENARRAEGWLFSIANARKVINGRLDGLLNPKLLEAKVKTENELRQKLNFMADGISGSAHDRIAEATRILAAQSVRYNLLESGEGFTSDSFGIARTLLRAAEEFPKPNGERLNEFSDSGKASLELSLFSTRPIYTDLETLLLGDALTALATELGPTDPLVVKVLDGRSPKERAAELIEKTQVRDVAFRKKLYEGGVEAVAAANDPMIELARLIDAEARQLRKVFEEQSEVKKQMHAWIAQQRNRQTGSIGYPDATFTLRLAYGEVKGYEEYGKTIAPITEIGGLYKRAAEMNFKPPFDLPKSWEQRRSRLNLNTPFNFVSTPDIIGGNSGSPVVNRAGEFVGIIFDGNLQSLPGEYAYSDEQARATSVHSAAILEALRKVYDAKELVRELAGGR